jgi:hypothetical protein
MTLGQLREGFDPPGATGGERNDRPERQLLEVLDREIRQFHGLLKGLEDWGCRRRRAAKVRSVPDRRGS